MCCKFLPLLATCGHLQSQRSSSKLMYSNALLETRYMCIMKSYFFGKAAYFDFNVSSPKSEVVHLHYVVFVVVFLGNSCRDDNLHVGLLSNLVKIVFWLYIHTKCFILIKERIKLRWPVLTTTPREAFSATSLCTMPIIKLLSDDDFLIL